MSKITFKIWNAVKKIFSRKHSISVRVAAKKLKIPLSILQFIKKKTMEIRAYSKLDAPKYKKRQKELPKTGWRKIYKNTRSKILVNDDESKVPICPSNIPGWQYY